VSYDYAQEFLKSIYPLEGVDTSLQCGRVYSLTDRERAIVKLAHWMRNLNLGLKGSIKKSFHPGPRGRRDKNGWWWPVPNEGCDQWLSHWEEGKKPDPWALWKHCRGIQHTEYLVKHRIEYLVNTTFNGIAPGLILYLLHCIIEDVPDTKLGPRNEQLHWMIAQFYADYGAGKFKDPENHFVLNTRFDLLKIPNGGA